MVKDSTEKKFIAKWKKCLLHTKAKFFSWRTFIPKETITLVNDYWSEFMEKIKAFEIEHLDQKGG